MTNPLISTVLPQVIKMSIIKLREIGVNVHKITFDGTHRLMLLQRRSLVARFLKSVFFFKDVNHNRPICVMIDTCHMLKLCRNTYFS